MAYCMETSTSEEYTKMMVALRATAPDNSTSRSDSPRSPQAFEFGSVGLQDGTVPELGTNKVCGMLVGRPKKLRYSAISLSCSCTCPATASFCPVPEMPALYRGEMS